jgi:hypothetical protein
MAIHRDLLHQARRLAPLDPELLKRFAQGTHTMPLRDHFRPPIDDVHSWDELHGMWPAIIVQSLVKRLPEPYFAAPSVHLGTLFEVDVGTYGESASASQSGENDTGGVSLATYAPPKPTWTLEPILPEQDVYEVRIFESRRSRRLLAAIEIISPSNKDRPESRGAFVSKVATLIKHNISVSIVDVVSTSQFNLYADLLEMLDAVDGEIAEEPMPMYAVTMRMRREQQHELMDNWYYPLAIGEKLPTLPIWLNENWAIPFELEATYEETCQTLRIR